ncbi:desiccation-related protein PCC13-62-like [Andrographis paniculata]|uniref:desiccation-related protein PCC13-62-like n=1 Tax=Andrographis paniculata TaxID=175694 RepID=UPI0021E6E265|nr:desiccation-related protein PCC13-62-like [Andrographis paniculata]
MMMPSPSPSPFTTTIIAAAAVLVILACSAAASHDDTGGPLPKSDVDLLEFPLNLEYLEAEFFAWGALGRGLDQLAPDLAKGGPPPAGVKQASLSPLIKDIITQFAYQEFGHLRAIQHAVKGFPRPALNLSAESFARVMDDAFQRQLEPAFDPYATDLNYLIASYVVPYVGLTGYVGANPKLQSPASRELVAGLLGVESGQDAVLRALLYERANEKVAPYNYTVAEFTNRISGLRNKLGKKGVKDEGLVVEAAQGAEGKVEGNVLAGDRYSLAFGRSPLEILRIVYASGSEAVPGGFYPKGADGRIAKSHLDSPPKIIKRFQQ